MGTGTHLLCADGEGAPIRIWYLAAGEGMHAWHVFLFRWQPLKDARWQRAQHHRLALPPKLSY